MKKKILLALLLITVFTCLFAIGVSAETPEQYIGFKVLLEGDTEYTTVYSTNDYDQHTPRISLAKDFYTEPEQTNVVDKTEIVKIDMTDAVAYGCVYDYVKQVAAPTDATQFANVTEIIFPNEPGEFEFITSYTCKGWASLTTVDFGSATQISDSAFENCTFTEFTVPAQIVKFNNNAFKGCASLQKVTVEGKANFGSSIFQNCTSLTDVNLVQPQIIGSSMFQGCSSLTKITIPEGPTEIGTCAFMGTGITALHIPASVTKIGYQVAEDVTTLTSLTFAANSQLTFIAHRTFQRSGLNGAVVIPEGVTQIDYSAFASTAITSVTLPSTLVTTGSSVFYGCTGLTEVTIPDSVTTLGSAAFQNCSNLEKLNISANSKISNSLTSICRGCTKLESIFIPPLVKELGADNFWDCTSLKEVNFSEGLTTISGGNNFANCTSLTKIEYPNSLVTLAGGNICHSIKEIRFGNSITSIGAGNLTSKALERVYIPVSLTTIGDHILGYSSSSDSSTNITFIFTGTKEQAEALQTMLKNYTEEHDANTTGLIQGPNSSKFYDAELVSATEYDADNTTPSGYHFVYDYSACKAFYDNVHQEKAPTYDFCGQKYISDLYEYVGCNRCNVVTEEKAGDAIFTSRGYSKDETSGSIMYDILVNYNAMDFYTEKTGATVAFGLAVSGNSALTSLINEDETIASSDVLKIKFDGTSYTKLQIKILNIGTSADARVHACAYVIENKEEVKTVSYIGNGTTASESTAVSYAEIPSTPTTSTEGTDNTDNTDNAQE